MKIINKFLSIFQKSDDPEDVTILNEIDINQISFQLAYEVARSDGKVSIEEESYIKKKLEVKGYGLSMFDQIKSESDQSSSFYELISHINDNCEYSEKLTILENLWEIAFSDGTLISHEERIIRRIADLIRIKNIDILKIKDKTKNS